MGTLTLPHHMQSIALILVQHTLAAMELMPASTSHAAFALMGAVMEIIHVDTLRLVPL